MLIGQYFSKLTQKNRVAVPKKFREELGSEMIVARWYEGCCVLVSKQNWQNLIDRLIGRTHLVISPIRDIDRFILGSAFEVSLDSQGRFVLPEVLVDFAGLKEEVVFLGLGDRVEIWAKEKWIDLEKSAEEKASLAIEKIAKEEKWLEHGIFKKRSRNT